MQHQYNTYGNGGQPPANQTPLEAYLTATHGDLHDVIPSLLAQSMSQADVARALSTPARFVSQAWLSNWLAAHGYRKTVRWEREGGAK